MTNNPASITPWLLLLRLDLTYQFKYNCVMNTVVLEIRPGFSHLPKVTKSLSCRPPTPPVLLIVVRTTGCRPPTLPVLHILVRL